MELNISRYDNEFYDKYLSEFLPDRIIDIHSHVWLDKFRIPGKKLRRGVEWPILVAKDNSIEDLIKTNEFLFPNKNITPVIFGQPSLDYDIVQGNDYISECSKRYKYPGLMLTTPEMDLYELQSNVTEGGFHGMKVYFEYAPSYIPSSEIRIFDYLPREHIELADRNGWIVMLHIPRPGRLRDKVNLAQMIEIDKMCKNARVIIAHVGRAYSDEDIGNSFEILSVTQNLLFDISANTNANVFTQLMKTVGTERVLYGSDLPIFRMRGRRESVDGRYVNIVPKGIYGDLSDDRNMREEHDPNRYLTFMLYEELFSFRQACKTIKASKEDIDKLFYGNASSILNI